MSISKGSFLVVLSLITIISSACTIERQVRAHDAIALDGKAVKDRTEDALAYSVGTTINAPSSTVWQILTNAQAYTSWNTTIVSLQGDIAKDKQIDLIAKIDPDRTFGLTVSEFKPHEHMVWEDGMILGLFSGVRTFTLRDRGDNTTDFTMEEVFSGGMLGMIEDSLPDFRESFSAFAADLKKHAEEGRPPSH